MGKFLTKRFIQMFLLYVIFLTAIFFLLEAQPGDVSQQFVGNPDIPPEARELLRHQLGLDQGLWLRYVSYIKNTLTLHYGESYIRWPTPVSDIIFTALPRTLLLFFSGTVLAYWLGFKTGKVVAWKRGTFIEQGTMAVGLTLYNLFYPWFALLMLWLFAAQLGWAPVGKFITPEVWFDSPFSSNRVFLTMIGSAVVLFTLMALVQYYSGRIIHSRTRRSVRIAANVALIVAFVLMWAPTEMSTYAADIVKHTLLPVATLTLISFAGVTLLTRSSMLETLREDYILTARAKGVPDRTIRDRHAARNALLPVTTSFVLAVATVISGGIVTETIFSWPGLGLELLNAVNNNDTPVALGVLAMLAILTLLAHLIVDIMYAYLDPRIRFQG